MPPKQHCLIYPFVHVALWEGKPLLGGYQNVRLKPISISSFYYLKAAYFVGVFYLNL